MSTQTRHPWRATIRTAFAVIVALAAMLPLLVDASGLDETAGPVAGALAIAAAITRVMALPAVDDFLARFLPFLAADPDGPINRHGLHLEDWSKADRDEYRRLYKQTRARNEGLHPDDSDEQSGA